jgi:hypothetical protein
MKKVFSFLLGLITLGFIGWGLWEAINWYLSITKSFDKQVAAAIIVHLLPYLFLCYHSSLQNILRTSGLSKKIFEIKKSSCTKSSWRTSFISSGQRINSECKAWKIFTWTFAPGFITWRSDEVLKHWSDFRKVASKSDSYATLLNFQKPCSTFVKMWVTKTKALIKIMYCSVHSSIIWMSCILKINLLNETC